MLSSNLSSDLPARNIAYILVLKNLVKLAQCLTNLVYFPGFDYLLNPYFQLGLLFQNVFRALGFIDLISTLANN